MHSIALCSDGRSICIPFISSATGRIPSVVPHFQHTSPALSHSISHPAEMLSITPSPSACSFPPPTVFLMNLRTLLAIRTGMNFLQGHTCRDGLQVPYPTSASRLRVVSLENSACAPAECPHMHTRLSRVDAPLVASTSASIAFASSGVRSKMFVMGKTVPCRKTKSKLNQLIYEYQFHN